MARSAAQEDEDALLLRRAAQAPLGIDARRHGSRQAHGQSADPSGLKQPATRDASLWCGAHPISSRRRVAIFFINPFEIKQWQQVCPSEKKKSD
jgi:hypothetical protein